MTWTLRVSSFPGMITKGSDLSHTEMDANLIEAFSGFEENKKSLQVELWDNDKIYSPGSYVRDTNNYIYVSIGFSSSQNPPTSPAAWRPVYTSELAHVKGKDESLFAPTANVNVSADDVKVAVDAQFRTVAVSITAPQLQTANTTPIMIVPAPLGLGMLFPVRAHARLNYSTAAYNAVDIFLSLGSGTFPFMRCTGLMASAATRARMFEINTAAFANTTQQQLVQAAPINLSLSGAPGTTGQGSLKVYVTYQFLLA